jgi:hypothetical protein
MTTLRKLIIEKLLDSIISNYLGGKLIYPMRYCTAILVAMLCLMQTNATRAQETTSTDIKIGRMTEEMDYEKPLFERPIVVSINLGTAGIGAETKLHIAPRWKARMGVSVLPVSVRRDVTLENTQTDVNFRGNVSKFSLLGEFRPIASSSFRIVAGAAYFFSTEANAKIMLKNDYKYGEISMKPEEVGYMNANVNWNGLAPYLGIGLFNSIPTNLFNVTLDLGTYYLPKPEVKITSTKLLSNNESNKPILEENLKDYRWLPTAQVNFNFRIQ